MNNLYKAMKELQKSKARLNEEKVNDFFYNQGLQKAFEVTKREQHLNCCNIVSKEVSELAKQYNINCKPVDLNIFTKIEYFTGHTVILYNYGRPVLIDYTQNQFFGTNLPDDVECKAIKLLASNYEDSFIGLSSGNIFSNNKFYYDGKEIKDIKAYSSESNSFITDYCSGTIDSDNDSIIYLM